MGERKIWFRYALFDFGRWHIEGSTDRELSCRQEGAQLRADGYNEKGTSDMYTAGVMDADVPSDFSMARRVMAPMFE